MLPLSLSQTHAAAAPRDSYPTIYDFIHCDEGELHLDQQFGMVGRNSRNLAPHYQDYLSERACVFSIELVERKEIWSRVEEEEGGNGLIAISNAAGAVLTDFYPHVGRIYKSGIS